MKDISAVKVVKILICVICAIIFFVAGIAYPNRLAKNQTKPEPVITVNQQLLTGFYKDIDSQAKQIIESVHKDDFGMALKIASEIEKSAPDHPAPYFFKAAIYDNVMSDYADYRFESDFDENIDKAITLATKQMKENTKNGITDDFWLHFYLGGSLGFRGLHKFLKNDWLAAFKDGMSGVQNLQTAIKINPGLFDVYYGLGCFHYWVSAKSKVLWFLPFVDDKRDKGIEELLIAVKKGLYTNIEAKYAVLRIYNNEKMFDQAVVLADKLSADYPHDVFCLYQKADALRGLQQWDKSIPVYDRLIELYMNCQLHCFEKICEVSYLKTDSLKYMNDKKSISGIYGFLNAEKKRRKSLGQSVSKEALKHIQGIKKIMDSL